MKKYKRFLILMIVFAVMVNNIKIYEAAMIDNAPEIILDYAECLNNGKVEDIVNLLHESEKGEFTEFVSSPENKSNHIGYFNYKKVEIISAHEYIDGSEILEYTLEDYLNVEELSYWECILDVETYRESNYLSDGLNRFIFVLGMTADMGDSIIAVIRDKVWSENAELQNNENYGVSTLGYDTPVSAPALGKWQNPATIAVEGYGDVNFYDYCKVVTMNEIGKDSYNQTARIAGALAIKNYAWQRTLVQKYHNCEYDVKATIEDMVYNPNNTASTKVENAVNAIWNYVMLSCDYKLFCAFFVSAYSDERKIKRHAVFHGGVLSHAEANSLGNDGSSWEDILHYFYDYGTYNVEVTAGVIKIVNLNHSQSLSSLYLKDSSYHWTKCLTCGCIHAKYAHTWVTNGGYGFKCSVCGLTAQNVVAKYEEDVSKY